MIQITEKTMSECSPLTASLPVEILFDIFIYVGKTDLQNVAATSSIMNKLVNYNEVWRGLFRVYFPNLKIPNTVSNWKAELLWTIRAERQKARYSFNQMYGLCGRIPQKPESFPESDTYFVSCQNE